MRMALALRLAGAGLFMSAAAWAIHQQVGVIAASWSCKHAPQYIWLSGVVVFVLLAAGSLISWRALVQARHEESNTLRPRHFMAQVALMAALIFSFALILQIAASFFLPGCAG